MRPNSEAYEEMDFLPSIADGERVRFDIRRVSSVRKLRQRDRMKHLVSHPMTMVVAVWLVMAILLALEAWR